MPLVRNVAISDATHQIANNLNGNLEYKQLDLYAAAGVAGQLNRGAFYSATDGAQQWKLMYTGSDPQYLHFQVM